MQFIFLLSGLVCYGQAPDITYGDYRFIALESDMTPFFLSNSGGPVPPGSYGQTSTFAGSGMPSNRDGKSEVAGFHHPSGIAAGKNGIIYVADEKNNSIRRIEPNGEVSTIVKGLNKPAGIALDRSGNLYIADCYNHLIRRLSPEGKLTTLAGSGKAGDSDNVNGLLAQFRYPVGVAADELGNIYVSDEGNHKIRKISPQGAVSTLAGNGRPGNNDDEDGRLAAFNQPVGIAVDANGNIYVADQLNHKIRLVSPGGSVSTLAGSGFAGSANHSDPAQASFNNPRAVTVGAAGWIYVCDTGNQLIRRIGTNKSVSTLAGSGASGSTDNREGTRASFFFPAALAENESGLFVADCLNHQVRRIATTGFKVTPSLMPPGLNFDYRSGAVIGKPLTPFPGQTYQIVAYNAFGVSSTRLTLSASAQPGNALKFDGIDDQVFVHNDSLLTPSVVTVEMWVKLGNGLPNHRFILKRNTLPHFDESYSLGVDPKGYFELLMSSGTGLVGSQVRIRNKVLPIANKWYFIAGVFSDKDARLYVDGQLAAEAETGFPISRSNNGLFLNFDERSQMTVDEVRLFNYDRSASFKEDMVQPLSPTEPGLIAYYDFNMGIAGGRNAYATLFDKTRNGLNGEMQHFYPATGIVSNWVESYAMVVPASPSASQISRNGFKANWSPPLMGHADHYLLDVATDLGFEQILAGYNGKKVSSTYEEVDGLRPGTPYYFRVRACKIESNEQGGDSQITRVITRR